MADPHPPDAVADLVAELEQWEAEGLRYGGVFSVSHARSLIERAAAALKRLAALAPPEHDRFVRCSIQFVDELKAAESAPITIRITETLPSGELRFEATRYDCPSCAALQADRERLTARPNRYSTCAGVHPVLYHSIMDAIERTVMACDKAENEELPRGQREVDYAGILCAAVESALTAARQAGQPEGTA